MLNLRTFIRRDLIQSDGQWKHIIYVRNQFIDFILIQALDIVNLHRAEIVRFLVHGQFKAIDLFTI